MYVHHQIMLTIKHTSRKSDKLFRLAFSLVKQIFIVRRRKVTPVDFVETHFVPNKCPIRLLKGLNFAFKIDRCSRQRLYFEHFILMLGVAVNIFRAFSHINPLSHITFMYACNKMDTVNKLC